jgi:hypothetical protein
LKIEIKEVGSIIPYEMKAGIITKIKVGDCIYVLEKMVIERTIEERPRHRRSHSWKDKKKAHRLHPKSPYSKVHHTYITPEEIDAVLRHFSFECPEVPRRTLSTVAGLTPKRLEVTLSYLRQVKKLERSGNPKHGFIYHLKSVGKPIRKNRVVRPEGSLFSKTYNSVIKKEEIDAVKQAILKVELGYIPTSKNIILTTGFKQFRVNAILDVLRKNNIVTRENDNEGRVIYRVI